MKAYLNHCEFAKGLLISSLISKKFLNKLAQRPRGDGAGEDHGLAGNSADLFLHRQRVAHAVHDEHVGAPAGEFFRRGGNRLFGTDVRRRADRTILRRDLRPALRRLFQLVRRRHEDAEFRAGRNDGLDHVEQDFLRPQQQPVGGKVGKLARAEQQNGGDPGGEVGGDLLAHQRRDCALADLHRRAVGKPRDQHVIARTRRHGGDLLCAQAVQRAGFDEFDLRTQDFHEVGRNVYSRGLADGDGPYAQSHGRGPLRLRIRRRQIAHTLKFVHGPVTLEGERELFRVVKLALALAERFRRLDGEAHGRLDVYRLRASRSTAGDRRLRRQRHADDRRFGGRAGLEDAVQVIEPVAVGRDVGHAEGKNLGQLPRDGAHDLEQIFADAQDPALLDRRRDGKAAGVDDPVAARRVDGQDGVQLLAHFFAVGDGHVDGRTHERHGIVRACRRIGADVSGDEHVAFERVALFRHVAQFHGDGHGRHGAVAVGNEPDPFGARADAAETADDTDGGGCAAVMFAFGAVEPRFDEISAAFGAVNSFDGDLFPRHAGGHQRLFDALAAYGRRVEQFKRVHRIKKRHDRYLLDFLRLFFSLRLLRTRRLHYFSVT